MGSDEETINQANKEILGMSFRSRSDGSRYPISRKKQGRMSRPRKIKGLRKGGFNGHPYTLKEYRLILANSPENLTVSTVNATSKAEAIDEFRKQGLTPTEDTVRVMT